MTTYKMNVGNRDREARVVLGVVLIAFGIAIMGTWGVVLGVVGFVPLITGLTGWCPLYASFRVSTCKFVNQ